MEINAIHIRRSVTVPHNCETMRFSSFAEQEFAELPSRKAVKKAIKKELFLLDGAVAHSGDWVKPGMEVNLLWFEDNRLPVFDLSLEIVFEDESLAVINKPSGVPVSGNVRRTVQNALAGCLLKSTLQDRLHIPRPVHRLDSLTSGILLVAKTYSSAAQLGQQFSDRTVKKEYSAIVHGSITEPITVQNEIDGKPAWSDIVPVQVCRAPFVGTVTFVRLYPNTGRTHQLRIHCSQIGHPILGDRIYCHEATLNGKGLFLCASAIEFSHPLTQEPLAFKIAVPHKFDKISSRSM